MAERNEHQAGSAPTRPQPSIGRAFAGVERPRAQLALPLPAHARQLGDSVAAVTWPGGRLGYAELSAAADDLARRLAAAGVVPGDRVAALLPNGPLFVALVHAVGRIGAALVPLNTRLAPQELAWQLADSRPRVVMTVGALADRVVPESGAGDSPTVVVAGGPRGTDLDARGLPRVEVQPDTAVALRESVDDRASHVIMYTSGTSGRPKGAVLTHGALAWSAAASAARLGVSADDTWLVPLPLFHVGGLAVLVRSALYGTEVLLVEGFEPADVADHLVSGQATLASLVPTMLSRVLDVWDDEEQVLGRTVRACRQIRAVLLGGGPIAPTLLGRAARHGVPIALTYGLTEAASQVATAQPTTSPRLADGLPPLPYTEVAIRDEHGRSAPIGAVGEIVVKAPGNFSGYWHGAAEGGTGAQLDAAVGGTGARLDAAGWLHTGDGGYLDERGNLHVVGRRADLIVTGGENVYPAEVEAAIERHPGVTECCVVGLPDDEWGSRVVAAVVSGPGRGVSDRELELTAREVLAGYKVPRAFVRWGDRLPRNAAGKLRRSAVRDELEWRRASEAAAEAPPASVDFERAWLERLARCLEEHGDDELRERVLQGSEGLTDESSRREVIEWTRKAMERLTALTDPRTSHDVMSGCACQYPVSQLRDARRAYKESGDVAAAVAVLQAQFEDFLTNQLGLSESLVRRVVDLGWGLAGRLEGNTVFATKIPKSGSLEEYLAEPDPEKRRALYCHCPRVRDAVAMGEDLPLTYCLCGAGFYRGIWEEILQRPVRVEVVRSVLSGDDVCTVAVHLD